MILSVAKNMEHGFCFSDACTSSQHTSLKSSHKELSQITIHNRALKIEIGHSEVSLNIQNLPKQLYPNTYQIKRHRL